MEQAGKGALQEAFEKLKARLKDEGLFEEKHKQALPKYPRRIGVITSATGAAFHDIRDTVAKRWPLATLVLHHASVQGVKAAPELVRAIEYFTREKNVDVLVVGRGGGSLEDLWPFNEEAVARALFACPLPVISAVGHETDFSISDFVADVRAATPTQAAILATPDINEQRMYVDDLATRVAEGVPERILRQKERVSQLLKSHALGAIRQKVINTRERIHSYAGRLKHVGERTLTGRRDRLKRLAEQLRHRGELQLSGRRERLTELRHRLEMLDMNAPLERGFVRVHQEGRWVRKAEAFDNDAAFELEWKDRRVDVHP
ncbi:MAG: exodeoxyribonuclease VII large subunit [Balneolaceae bacterium]|nr:exodeoxyribonuclease VII large subunit [Balneolaceae bacterium]